MSQNTSNRSRRMKAQRENLRRRHNLSAANYRSKSSALQNYFNQNITPQHPPSDFDNSFIYDQSEIPHSRNRYQGQYSAMEKELTKKAFQKQKQMKKQFQDQENSKAEKLRQLKQKVKDQNDRLVKKRNRSNFSVFSPLGEPISFRQDVFSENDQLNVVKKNSRSKSRS